MVAIKTESYWRPNISKKIYEDFKKNFNEYTKDDLFKAFFYEILLKSRILKENKTLRDDFAVGILQLKIMKVTEQIESQDYCKEFNEIIANISNVINKKAKKYKKPKTWVFRKFSQYLLNYYAEEKWIKLTRIYALLFK